VASEVPTGISPLRQAARGLGLIFTATAFGCMTYIAQMILRALVSEWRWRLIPLAVWGLLDFLALWGRWLCLRARASRQTKMILRSSMLLTGLSAIGELTFPILLSLIIYDITPLDPMIKRILQELDWLDLVVPLLWLASTLIFLFYLRGLAQATERTEFASDAVTLMVEALMIIAVIPLAVAGLVWLCDWMQVFRFHEMAAFLNIKTLHQAWPGFMLAILLLSIYPFIRYCNLLTQFRDALLRQAEAEESQKQRKKPYPQP